MSLFTLRTGATAHPEDSVMQDMTDFIRAGGVLDLSDDDNLLVSEKSGTPDMSVDIATGRCWIKGSGNSYPVRNTATINQAISSNASGNPRIDAVVFYVDAGASPNSTASNVIIVGVVEGTPAPSPVAPTDSAIQTAVGAANAFLRLADVTVPDGTPDIEDGDIEDQRIKFRLKGSLLSGTKSFSATPEFDVSQENYQKITMTASVTAATVIGDQVDIPFAIKVIQAGSGSYTFAFWSNIDWFGGTPVLSTIVGEVDSFMFIKKSDGRYDGYIMGQGGSIA